MKKNSRLTHRSRVRNRTLGGLSAVLVATAVGGRPGVAAEGAAARDSEAEPLTEVVVTGTLLRRTVSRGSQMITSIDEQSLRSSGAVSATQALEKLAQNQSVEISNTSIGAGTGFASFANLRSLGAQNTLVLFDNRRMVNSPYTSRAVDLNTIPLNLVERVETLADGASSVYGSDAVAGVINFIPRTDFEGLEISATGTLPEASGGGRDYKLSAVAGYGDLAADGFNVFAGVTYRDQQALKALDRNFSATTYIPDRGVNRLTDRSFPANYTQAATGLTRLINPSSPACNGPGSIFANGVSGPQSCSFDFAPSVDNIVPQEDTTFVVNGTLQLGSARVKLQYLYAESTILSTIAPNNLSGFFTLTNVNPFYPGNGATPAPPGLNRNLPIALAFGNVPVGDSITEVNQNSDRILLEVQGDAGRVGYSAWALRSTAQVDLDFKSGYVSFDAMRDMMLGANGAPFFNPFGAQSTAAQAYLDANTVRGTMQKAESDLKMAGVEFQAELLELPAGALQGALALDYRDESTSFVTDPRLALTRRTGLTNGATRTGDRQAYSVTFEAVIPITEGLELNPSVRYDHYSDVGASTNPKIQVTYRPARFLDLRGSYSTGFRAPTLDDINRPTGISVSTFRVNDPVLCPGGVVNTVAGGIASRDCNKQYESQTGGNVDLDPEESDIYTLGITVRPADRLQISADYWNYRIEKTIGVINVPTIAANTAQFGSLIVRCASAPASILNLLSTCLQPTGNPIGYFDIRQQNLGETRTSGVDFTVRYQTEEMSWGRLAFDYRSSLTLEYDFQRQTNGEFFDRLGQYAGVDPAVFEYQHVASLEWSRDRLSGQLSNRYRSGYTDCNAACLIPAAFHQSVDAYSTWDLAFTYQPFEALTVTLRVANLLDQDPPFTNKTSGLATGWDERFANPLGRAFGLGVTYRF